MVDDAITNSNSCLLLKMKWKDGRSVLFHTPRSLAGAPVRPAWLSAVAVTSLDARIKMQRHEVDSLPPVKSWPHRPIFVRLSPSVPGQVRCAGAT